MFDDKKAPQDIFEGVEPPANLPVAGALAATTPTSSSSEEVPTPRPPSPIPPVSAPRQTTPLPPSSQSPSTAQTPIHDRRSGLGGQPWKTILIVIVAFTAMGLAAFLAYRFMNPPDKSANNSDRNGVTQGDNEDQPDDQDGKGSGNETEDDTPPVVEQEALDNDGDGLTNAKELTAGTDIASPDTDGDALGDREEVQVYGTDPLNPDSDGDTFKDGQEIKSGYNPKGPGKLFEIPSNAVTE